MKSADLLIFGQTEQREALKVNNKISEIIRQLNEEMPAFDTKAEKRSATELVMVLKQFKAKTGMYLMMLKSSMAKAENLSKELRAKAELLRKEAGSGDQDQLLQRAIDIDTSAQLALQSVAMAKISEQSLQSYITVIDESIEKLTLSHVQDQLSERLKILTVLNTCKEKERTQA